jgi:acetate kinase
VILTLNPGSSSIKAGWFSLDGTPLEPILNLAADWHATDAPRTALTPIITDPRASHIDFILHRVVHGGEQFHGVVKLTPMVREVIAQLAPLAPLHNPISLALIAECERRLPGAPQFAVFDTAFHHTLPSPAASYALPKALTLAHGIRRYGFHGISHAAVAGHTSRALDRPGEALNIISLHLGHGASACAIRGGNSVDTSMGMTPAEGLVMGSRCGDVDAGALVHLVRNAPLNAEQLDTLINQSSGLLGLCGESDMRRVREAANRGDESAQQALAIYVHRLRRYIGAFYAVLGRVDALVFTGGVGQNDAALREDACAGLDGLGIQIDSLRNQKVSTDVAMISPPSSPVSVLVIRADEEQEMVRQLRAMLTATGEAF